MRTLHLMLLLTVLAFSSCKASVKADINTSSDEPEEEDQFAMNATQTLPTAVSHTEYIGIARRLTLTPVQRPANCRCVSAVIGPASDPNFDWHGERPKVGPDALVVAIGTDGIACDHPGRGPSIAAIDRSGNDVIIVLEEFHDTRPIALGAIIPNPGPDGLIYMRAKGRTVYGRPDGVGHGFRRNLCRIGTGTHGAAIQNTVGGFSP